jgi:phosphate:Na+ symporter
LNKTAEFHQHLLSIDNSEPSGFFQTLLKPTGVTEHFYERLKKIEGEILMYCSNLQPDDLDSEQRSQINQYLEAVRNAIHSAKALKDIYHNVKDLTSTGDDSLHKQYKQLQDEWKSFDITFKQLLTIQDQEKLFNALSDAMKNAFQKNQENSRDAINMLKMKLLTEIQTSTMMNVQLEVLSAKKSLLRALAHLKLSEKQADAFEFLPES